MEAAPPQPTGRTREGDRSLRFLGSPGACSPGSWTPAGPAQAYGLERPRIAVGAPANLVLLDPARSWRVSEQDFRSRSANSWLLGETLKGKVRLTIAAGRIAYEA